MLEGEERAERLKDVGYHDERRRDQWYMDDGHCY